MNGSPKAILKREKRPSSCCVLAHMVVEIISRICSAVGTSDGPNLKPYLFGFDRRLHRRLTNVESNLKMLSSAIFSSGNDQPFFGMSKLDLTLDQILISDSSPK